MVSVSSSISSKYRTGSYSCLNLYMYGTVYALVKSAVAVCLDSVMLSVLDTSRYILVPDVSIILLWMLYDVSRAGLVLFGMIPMAVSFPVIISICQPVNALEGVLPTTLVVEITFYTLTQGHCLVTW